MNFKRQESWAQNNKMGEPCTLLIVLLLFVFSSMHNVTITIRRLDYLAICG